MQEREVKLSATDRFDLPNLGGLIDGVTANPREDELLSTTYLDSDDYRLARWGLSFRHRAGQLDFRGFRRRRTPVVTGVV
jgi:hypothetical protein